MILIMDGRLLLFHMKTNFNTPISCVLMFLCLPSSESLISKDKIQMRINVQYLMIVRAKQQILQQFR